MFTAVSFTIANTWKQSKRLELPKCVISPPWNIIQPLKGRKEFPSGALHKNSPANAANTNSMHGPGRFHVRFQQLSHNHCARVPHSLFSTAREATAMRTPSTIMKSRPHSPQLKKACAKQGRPRTAKNLKINEKEAIV